MEKFFLLKENGTTVSTEILAGLTTFFAMAYIIVVNPQILSQTGMPWGGVFLATIIAAIIGTLVMGLFANVPYAQAAGMGLNAFFTYTVCFGLGFSWQQTMCMVFLCGLINILITVTKIRKMIILAIPESLQHAIGGGIGLFVAYVGMLNVGLIKFTPGDPKAAAKGGAVAATPGLANFNDKVLWVFLIGLVLAIVFTVMKVKGGMLLAIAITTVIGIPFGVTTWSNSQSISETFSQLPQTFGAIFSAEGFPALFSDPTKLPLVIVTIFAFSMSDTFDTLGTFIGTGRRTGIFSAEDEKALENGHGFSSKMDKAGPGRLRRAVRRNRRRAGDRRLHDGRFPEGSQVGRHRRSHSGVLRRRVHGLLLLHLLRHRRRLHHVLHREDLQGQGQGGSPDHLDCGRAVHSGLRVHGDSVTLIDNGLAFKD